jgi:hypothetical protein
MTRIETRPTTARTTRPVEPFQLAPPPARPLSGGLDLYPPTFITRDEGPTYAYTGRNGILLAIGATIGLVIAAWQSGLLLWKVGAGVSVPFVLMGLWKGGLRKGVAAGFIVMVGVGCSWLGSSRVALGPLGPGAVQIGLVVVGVLCFLLARRRARVFRDRVIARSSSAASADRLGGAMIGLAEVAFVLLTLCWFAVALQPFAQKLMSDPAIPDGSPRQLAAKYADQLAGELSDGWAGRFVAATNPLDDIPALRDLVQRLNEDGTLRIDVLLSQLAPLSNLANDRASPQDTGLLQSLLKQYEEAAAKRSQGHDQLPSSNR